jgi:hypothetical protein
MAEISAVVDAQAALHAHFYADPALCDPTLGLCTPWQMFTWFTPTNRHTVQRRSTGS